jgi:5'-methylthioadenosine phosphorylase
MQRMAVIGGTGLLNMATGQPFSDAGLEVLATDSFDVETPYGIVPLKSFRLKHSSEEKTLVFLQRHHNGGSASKPPHMINHHANIWALKHAQVDAVLSKPRCWHDD